MPDRFYFFKAVHRGVSGKQTLLQKMRLRGWLVALLRSAQGGLRSGVAAQPL